MVDKAPETDYNACSPSSDDQAGAPRLGPLPHAEGDLFMRVVTISREFGSGGRELGKRLAGLLQFAYYDKEILSAVAHERQLDPAYVETLLQNGARSYPLTVGRTFAYPSYLQQNATALLVARQKVLKTLAAQGDCVVIGQNADLILHEYRPLNLFVYAAPLAKIERCRRRAPAEERLTDRQMQKQIRQIDSARAKSRELLSGLPWGRRESYHLCINTTGLSLKTLAPRLADYARYWFDEQETEQ